MIYMIICLLLLAGLAGWLGWRLYEARRALARSGAEYRELEQDHAIRQNLQRILDARDGEIRRLKQRLRQYEEQARALEDQTSQLNLTLFHESGLRILAEKEDGAKRMKLALLERQLDEANASLRQARAAAADRERALQEIVDQQNRQLDRQAADRGRRARRARQEAELDQVTINDLLGTVPDGGGE